MVRRGDQAPGLPPGVVLWIDGYYAGPELNNAGQLAFVAGYSPESPESEPGDAIYLANSQGIPHLIARSGDPVPGLLNSAFTSFQQEYNLNDAFQLNNNGQLAFLASWTMGDTEGFGLIGVDTSGQLHRLASVGDMIPVGDNAKQADLRQIETLGWYLPRVFELNDSGKVVFSALFTDGSNGIFTTTIPKPTTCIGDLDGDSLVGLADLQVLLSSFGSSNGGDVNGDGICDLDDLQLLLFDFGCGR